MAKVVTITYCEGIESNGGKNSIVNPLPILRPMYVPGMYSFGISVGIVDFNRYDEHTIRIVFRNSESKQEVINTDILPLPQEAVNTSIPDDLQNIVLNMEFKNAVFDQEGTYETVVYFDEEEIGAYPIKVKGEK